MFELFKILEFIKSHPWSIILRILLQASTFNLQSLSSLIKDEFKITLNCGIGTGKTARDAVKLATKSLDTIRDIRDSGKEKPEIYELVWS